MLDYFENTWVRKLDKKFKIEHYVGATSPLPPKKYRDRAAKKKKICTNYKNNTNIEDFLHGIVYNFNCKFNF